jgi:Fic family protein
MSEHFAQRVNDSRRRGDPVTERPRAVNHLNGRPLPEPATPAGYAALVDRYGLRVPLPPRLTAVAVRHHPQSTDDWQMLPPRRAPEDTLEGQLEFALKWEGVDLSVLNALFDVGLDAELAAIVRAKPVGAYTRRLWFLFEWLTRRTLDVPDAGKASAIPVIDSRQQFALERGDISRRHRVVDNLPGTRAFCPLVRRTAALNAFADRAFDRLAREVVGRTHPDVLSRAAAFLLLNDSKSSFWIEGERPSAARATRWGQVIGEAGTRPLSVDEFERLQRIVIGDARFVRLGLRTEGGFVGEHDRETREPIPNHISARSEDLGDLLGGITAYSERSVLGGLDPVAAAAAIAFGFVYVHPFEDGNGRVHRWLIHHVLATANYNPRGIVFPVSAAILREIDDYRTTLQSHSRRLLALIEWRPTKSGNVEVLNDTGDYYRYFDATAHAEFLYRCVAQTVERDLPDEVRFLEAFDQFRRRAHEVVDMPDRTVDLLHRFLRQGGGRLSRRAREREFAALTDAEVATLEQAYAEHLAGLRRPPATEMSSV